LALAFCCRRPGRAPNDDQFADIVRWALSTMIEAEANGITSRNVDEQVGNYGESYDRNLGDRSPLQVPRSLHAPWTKADILYVSPIR
jgi:general L-amino acid transport system substrate-binding protein